MNDRIRHRQHVVAIVRAYVSRNTLRTDALPDLVKSVSSALERAVDQPPPAPLKPAVPIHRSITPDYLISLEDGQKFRSLKRVLRVRYGMTPEEYRAKWGLPDNYPMVAPSYSDRRSELAKAIQLGRRRS